MTHIRRKLAKWQLPSIIILIMIHYVVAKNPDDRVIDLASQKLAGGGIIVFPTDTSWVFAASLMSKKGVDALYRIKGVDRKRHLSVLCNNISQASRYGVVSNFTYKIIHKIVPGPYTFILNPTRDIPRSIRDYRKQKQIGIRIPESVLCERLISHFHYPIITGSIDKDSILDDLNSDVRTDEIYSYQIEEIFGHQVEMIIDPGEFELAIGGSSVVDFSSDDEVPIVIREGAGDVSFVI